MNQDAIAIVGIAARLPDATTLDEFYDNLTSARDSVQPISQSRSEARDLPQGDYRIGGYLDGIDQFDHRYFGLSKREADFMDPQQRLLLQLAVSAIEDAAMKPSALAGSRCAVIACVGAPDYARLLSDSDPTETTGNHPAMVAGRVAHSLDLRAGAFGVESGCSSSLVAVHQARQLLQSGDADMVLVGAVRLLLTPPPARMDGNLGILSPDGKARAFDGAAAGTSIGEGAVALLLKPLARAVADGDPVHAVLLGTAVNQNGKRSTGMAAPSPLAQAEVLRHAWQRAGVSGEEIGFVEAHGTGTKLGDPIEVQGLTDAFAATTQARGFCELSAVKSNVGHLDCAAGLAGVAKALLSVREGRVFPTAHLARPNPLIDFETTAVHLTMKAGNWTGPLPRIAGVSAFSLNGTNAHIVLREPPAPATSNENSEGPWLVTLSAHRAEELAATMRHLTDALRRRRPRMQDIARTVVEGRDLQSVRAAFIARDLEHLIDQLDSGAPIANPVRSERAVLLASGEPGESFSAVLATINRYPHLAQAVLPALAPFDGLPASPRVEAFRVQFALARSLEACRVPVALVLGYGTGSLVSKFIAGKMDATGVRRALTEAAPALHAPDTARLAQVIQELRVEGSVMFLELSRKGVLADAVAHCIGGDTPALGSTDNLLLGAFARVLQSGLRFDPAALRSPHGGRRIHLPGTSFEPVRCWAPLVRTTPTSAVQHGAVGTEVNGSSAGQRRSEAVRRAFADVLGLPTASDEDDFFALGGNSLIATRLVMRLGEVVGRPVSLAMLFEAPLLGDLVQLLRVDDESPAPGDPAQPPLGADRTSPAPIVPSHRPLSSAQRRMHFVESLGAAGSGHLITESYILTGPLDTAAFAAAATDVINRHDVLRARYVQFEGEIVQRDLPADTPALIVETGDESFARARVRQLAATRFDLTREAPIRLVLIHIGPQSHVFAICAHHIAWDGASLAVFLHELVEIYQARSDRCQPAVPTLPWQYADYAEDQQQRLERGEFEPSLAYWLDALRDAPTTIELPFDSPRPLAMALPVELKTFEVSAELTRRLIALARENRASLFMVLQAAFGALLWLWTGQRDVLVATPVASRTDPRNEGLVGLFVNTLALRSDLSGNPRFTELIAQVRRTTLAGLSHQELPFDKVVEALNPPRDLSRQPVCQVMFAFQESARVGTPSLRFASFESVPATAKFDLACSMSLPGDSLSGQLEVPAGLLAAQNLERLAVRFVALLDAVSADSSSRASQWPAAAPEEIDLSVVTWNRTPGRTASGLLHAHFRAQARRTPGLVAVIDGDRRLSYEELDALSDTFAARLVERPELQSTDEPVIGVALRRSADTVICLMAILKAGAVYLPLDIDVPVARLTHMLQDARACLLLCDGSISIECDVPTVSLSSLDASSPLLAPALHQDSAPDADARLAYIVYTSGSTGQPKGVGVPHRAATSLAASRLAHDPIGPGDRILASISVGFDVSIGQLVLPLLNGAAVVIAPQLQRLDPRDFWALLERDEVTHINGVPSFFDAMIESLLQGTPPQTHGGLRQLMLGGEPLNPALVGRLRQALPGTRLANMYGPTEACIDATAYVVPDDIELPPLVPIGRPLPGYRCYVLDEAGRPVAIGATGELHLAGAGLARGYCGRPDETAARFVPDPFAPPGERMYRTGDRVRWRVDGQLEFHGRDDGQVKIRGFRVEVGEVEAALRGVPGVSHAAVVPFRSRRAGSDTRLCAYVVGDASFAVLRTALSRTLPHYMVPECFMRLDLLPLNTNGKLERRALPTPDEDAEEAPDAPLPLTVTQSLLVEIWNTLLASKSTSGDTDFFAAGGHSLLASRLVSRVRDTFGVELSLRDVFTTPRFSDIADRLVEMRGGVRAEPIGPRPKGQATVLATSAQARLWFLDQYEPHAATYVIPAAWRIRTQVNAQALASALAGLVARHEALRTTFTSESGQVFQVVAPALDLPLVQHDVSGDPDPTSSAVRLLQDEASTPFDLTLGPLVRAKLLRLSPDDHIFALTIHHIVVDGWSMGLIVKELGALYDLALGTGAPLPEVTLQYPDFSNWWFSASNQARIASQLAWWRTRLEGAPMTLDLPLDRPRPPRMNHRGSSFEFELDAVFAGVLRDGCRALGVTPFMVFAAAFNVFLHRLGCGDDICIGYTAAGRGRSDTENIVGLFANTMVLRTPVAANDRILDVLSRVREHTLEADAHADLPFERLIEALVHQRTLDRPPLVQVMLSFNNNEGHALQIAGTEAVFAGGRNDIAKFDLMLQVTEGAKGFACAFQYRTDLFEEVTVSRFARRFVRALKEFLPGSLLRVSDVEIADIEEHALLGAWSGRAPAQEDVPPLCHELFELSAAASAQDLALRCGTQEWRYAELNAAANRLAHHLRSMGIRPDSLVGICLPPSADLIIAILAVLKSGGAYVPLDPELPAARKALMIEDSQAVVVVTRSSHSSALALAPAGVAKVLLDEDAEVIGLCSSQNPDRVNRPGDLAYCIYTSGSTGTPKGALNHHAGLSRLLTWFMSPMTGARQGRERVLLASAIGFDLTQKNLLGPLCSGDILLLPEGDDVSLAAVGAAAARHRPTRINCAPSFYKLLRELPAVASIPTVILGGEQVDEKLAHAISNAGHLLINGYGPSECAAVAAFHRQPAGSVRTPVPIGRPLAHATVHVLDAHGRLSPIGVVGEICIGGAGVSRGYVGRQDLTALAFVPDPYGPPGTRLYRTGDLGRWLSDGVLQFTGRADRQLKLHGIRVELAEVEAAVVACEGVRDAVVAVHEERLVAYVATDDPLAVSPARLAARLSKVLPLSLLPSAYVVIDKLPLNANGKLDHAALPAPPAPVASRRPLQGDLAHRIAAMFGELTGKRVESADDNFFELGGHSLLAARLAFQIDEQFGVRVPLRVLFEHSSVDALASHLEAEIMKEIDAMPEAAIRALITEEGSLT